jgi:hypothetical protein
MYTLLGGKKTKKASKHASASWTVMILKLFMMVHGFGKFLHTGTTTVHLSLLLLLLTNRESSLKMKRSENTMEAMREEEVTTEEATKEEATTEEATKEEATTEEVMTEEATKEEATKEEEVMKEEATKAD